MLEGDIHRFPDERLGFVAQLRQDHAFGGGEVDQERKPLPDDAKRRHHDAWLGHAVLRSVGFDLSMTCGGGPHQFGNNRS